MDKYKILIDDIEFDEPRGFKDLREEVIRDELNRVITLNYNGSIEFYGYAYNYLRSIFNESYCAIVSFKIIKNGVLKINSTINLSDSLWDINKSIVSCELEEPVFQQKIFNNLDLKLYPSATKSINNEEINPAETAEMIIRYPVDGAWKLDQVRDVYVYRDVLRWFIDYFTDGESELISTLLDEWNTTDQSILMASGPSIMFDSVTGKQLAPFLSFKEMWENTWKTFNAWMIISGSNVVIEKEEYLYSSTNNVVEVIKPKELSRSVDLDRLFGRIKIGGRNSIKDLDNTTIDDSPFLYIFFRAFAQEEYKIGGLCNVDRALELERSFIADVNKYQVALDEDTSDYNRDNDDSIFVFVCAYSDFNSAWDPIDYSYSEWNPGNQQRNNEPYLNEEIIKRFNLQGDVILNSGLLTVNFLAFRNANFTLSGTIPTSNPPSQSVDVEDPINAQDVTAPGFPGNSYNAPTSTFTAPVNDMYSFEIEQYFQVSPGDVPNTALLTFDLGIELDNNSGNRTYATSYEYEILELNGEPNPNPLIETESSVDILVNGLINSGALKVRVKAFVQVYMEGSETATGVINLRASGSGAGGLNAEVLVYDGSFAQIANGTSGGNYDPKDPNEYYVHILEFEGEMTDEQFESLKQDPTQRILVTDKNGLERYGYVKSISRNVVKQTTEFTIIFNRKQANI